MVKDFIKSKIVIILVLSVLVVLAECGLIFSISQGGPFTAKNIYAFGSQFSFLLMCIIISQLIFYEKDLKIDEILFSNNISKKKSYLIKLLITIVFSMFVGILIIIPPIIVGLEILPFLTFLNYIALGIIIFCITVTLSAFVKSSIISFGVSFLLLYVVNYNTSHRDEVSVFNVFKYIYINVTFGGVGTNETLNLFIIALIVSLICAITLKFNQRRG